MKAILFDEPGGPEELFIGDFEKPKPKENEILVRVKAVALNRADILQRKGMYPQPEGSSPLLGLEIAGEVVARGKNATDWSTGDKAFGLISGGGYAELAVIHKDMALRIPEGLTFEEAASIPEVFLTAFQALVWLGKTQKGNFILIHAGGSGVGTAAIQIAKDLGAHVIITASKIKHQRCLDLGAELAIDYHDGPFFQKVLEYTNQIGVDIIIDFIAADYFNQNIDCLSESGRLIMLATLGGSKINNVNLGKILSKHITVVGSTLRSRSIDYKIKLNKEFSEYALPKFEHGELKAVIDSVWDWKDVSQAHRYMEENKNTGKIILKIS
jgi:putative PIG3 family NAD(P)H quinone oxidoreductase